MPEASRTHQLLYQQTQGGVLSYPFSLPAGIAGTTSELVVCLTAYDRGLQPLADLASHSHEGAQRRSCVTGPVVRTGRRFQ
jgi:hypothetical protein